MSINQYQQPSEGTGLTKADYDSMGLNPESFTDLMAFAKTLAASGFYKEIKTAQQAFAVMLMGREMGLSPVQSLTGIHIVQGKPMCHYQLLLAKVRQHPEYDYQIVQQSAEVCEIAWFRHGKDIGHTTFTAKDAQRQGTQNMAKFPDTMLLARCASNGVKRFCPDVTHGVAIYVEGELHEDAPPVQSKSERLAEQMKAKVAPARVVNQETGEVHEQEPLIEAEPYTGPVFYEEEGA